MSLMSTNSKSSIMHSSKTFHNFLVMNKLLGTLSTVKILKAFTQIRASLTLDEQSTVWIMLFRKKYFNMCNSLGAGGGWGQRKIIFSRRSWWSEKSNIYINFFPHLWKFWYAPKIYLSKRYLYNYNYRNSNTSNWTYL